MKIITLSLLFLSIIAIAHSHAVIPGFLSDDVLDEELAKLNITYHDNWAPIRFIAGFYHGLHLFDNVTETKECWEIYRDIAPDVQEIIAIVKKMEFNENIFEEMKRILDKLEHIHLIIRKKKGICGKAGLEMRKICMNLKNFLAKDPRRIQKTILHMIENIEPIKNYIKCIQENIMRGEWKWAGDATGEYVRFLIFWDYKPPMLYFLEDKY